MVVGAALGMQCAARMIWTALLATLVAVLSAALYAFAFHGICVPWLFPTAGLVGAAVTVFAEKTRVGERKVQGSARPSRAPSPKAT